MCNTYSISISIFYFIILIQLTPSLSKIIDLNDQLIISTIST